MKNTDSILLEYLVKGCKWLYKEFKEGNLHVYCEDNKFKVAHKYFNICVPLNTVKEKFLNSTNIEKKG